MADAAGDFQILVTPIVDYLGRTTARQQFADSYPTDNPKKGGMHARPVIGGVFVKFLADRATWKRWASADKTKTGRWALLPQSPKIVDVVPTSEETPQKWRYTIDAPSANWASPDFDDSSWQEGPGGFGNVGAHHTSWTTADIWIRRTFVMPSGEHANLQFSDFHDEDVEIYINGVPAAHEAGYLSEYQTLPIQPAARTLLKAGDRITLAAHCHQTTGGQGIDIGLCEDKD